MKQFRVCFLVLSLGLFARDPRAANSRIRPAPAADPTPSESPRPSGNANSATFRSAVLPIILGKCVRCHNNQARMLPNWVDYKTAFADRVEIRRRVWDSWKGHYFKQPMPVGNSPESLTITDSERELIKRWVDEGAPYGAPSRSLNVSSKAERMEQGKQIFGLICAACHQPNAQGLPNQFPPLAGSDFLNADKTRAINVVIHGLQGEVTVNGKTFNNSMPLLPLNDHEIASALTYVYNSFGNSGLEVTEQEVARQRQLNIEPSVTGALNARSSQPAAPTPFE